MCPSEISEQLDRAVLDATEQGCTLFYTGAMGEFDNQFSAAVRKAKKSYPNIKLVCVKPYMTKEINESGEYLYTLYDDIIIPAELADVHYKSVITKRNRWIISHSDVVIIYTVRNCGGAYNAMKYARAQSKTIFMLEV
ncbi:MAG: DUF1273 domain-containing protein [Clostridia bacterium]|nr:DUF1273 domain-containing protein [Clostridia bacterium]